MKEIQGISELQNALNGLADALKAVAEAESELKKIMPDVNPITVILFGN